MPTSDSNEPVTLLPNPGEGGPVYGADGGQDAVVLLPNPGEGGPVYDGEDQGGPVILLPNPGEGGPVDGGEDQGFPVIPLPNPGEGGPVYDSAPSVPTRPTRPTTPTRPPVYNPAPSVPTRPPVYNPVPPVPTRPVRYAQVRFLDAAYGYGAFRIRVNRTRVVNYLSFASLSSYGQIPSGYQTVTVTSTDGYIYIQKSLPFEADRRSTVAIINTAGGLDLLQIPDASYRPGNGYASFRVSNLAFNSRPMDVLLADGRVVYADVQFKETTAFKRIRPGEYEFLFAETTQSPMPSYQDIETLDSAFLGMYPVSDVVASLYLNVQRSRIYTAFLLISGRGTNQIQTLVVTD